MSILEEMLEMLATTVQAELNATLHVCESGIFLGLVPKELPCITPSVELCVATLFAEKIFKNYN
jgi:hypothetical protein